MANMLKLFLFLILGWNLIVAFTYGYDKFQSRRAGWRISERYLLKITLLLGGIGAFIGLFLFRHKIRKPLFQLVMFSSLIVSTLIIFLISRQLLL